MRVLAICGSLRAASSNKALLTAYARLAPAGTTVTLYEEVGTLPHFNPDIDGEGASAPTPVARFRTLLRACDAVVISTPEYVHSVPGAFKNALDWIVSSGEFENKPVAMLNASAGGGEYVQAQVAETLTVMMAEMIDAASLKAPLARQSVSPDGTINDPALIEAIRQSHRALSAAVASRKSAAP